MLIAISEPVGRNLVDGLQDLGEVRYDPSAWRDAERVARVGENAALLVTRSKTEVSRSLLDRWPALRCVVVYGAGTDHLHLAELREREIDVLRSSAATATSVAEFTLALTLNLLRRIPEALEQTASGGWDHRALIGSELAGKTVCVVGCGPMGAYTARLFAHFQCDVRVARKSKCTPLPQGLRRLGCRLAELDEALAEAAVVSLHVPGGRRTSCLLDRPRLERLSPSSIVVNTSRGSVLDFESVVSLVREGRLGGAAMDVLQVEPPPSPLPSHPRLLFTPHLALYSREAIQRRVSDILEQVASWIREAG